MIAEPAAQEAAKDHDYASKQTLHEFYLFSASAPMRRDSRLRKHSLSCAGSNRKHAKERGEKSFAGFHNAPKIENHSFNRPGRA